MWLRFTLFDVRVVAHYLGVLVSFFTIALAVPLVVAIAMREWEPASRYLLAVGISLIVGSGLRLVCVQPGKLTHQQALAVTGLSWIVLAFVASVPLALSGHYGSYLDSLMEAVSGLTTTGVTLVIDLEHLSTADNMWRFVMHLIGGLGLIVVALSLGLLGKATSGLYSSEGRSEHVLPNIVNTVRLISRISLTAIAVAVVILFVMCVLSGMEPVRAFFHSLWISISGFITGGFAPTSQSIGYYHSFALEIVCMVLMLLGAINFFAVRENPAWRNRFPSSAIWKSARVPSGFIVATIALMASTCASGGFSDLMALLHRGVFMVVAAATTTGFQNVTNNQLTTVFSSGAFLIIAVYGNRIGSAEAPPAVAFAHRPYCQIDGFHPQ